MRSSTNKPLLDRIASVVAMLLAAVVAAYGLFLLLVGQRLLAYPEGVYGPGAGQIIYDPTIVGIVPLGGGLITLGGLVSRRLWVAWLGFCIAALYSILFLFGTGGVLLPVTASLLVTLVVSSWLGRRTQIQ